MESTAMEQEMVEARPDSTQQTLKELLAGSFGGITQVLTGQVSWLSSLVSSYDWRIACPNQINISSLTLFIHSCSLLIRSKCDCKHNLRRLSTRAWATVSKRSFLKRALLGSTRCEQPIYYPRMTKFSLTNLIKRG
jgi:hypothetical protein